MGFCELKRLYRYLRRYLYFTNRRSVHCNCGWRLQEAPMFTVSLVAVSLAACSFLSYVFMQFCRELMHAGKNGIRSLESGSRSMRREWSSMIERSMVRHSGAEGSVTRAAMSRPAYHSQKRVNNSEEAVVRKQMVTSLVVGVIGLLAPFI